MHRNNYNLLRLMFALAVIFSHSFALLGQTEPVLWDRSLGNLSVHGFFVISGYLITESYLRNPKPFAFVTNRFLRIVPALFVALLFSHLVWHLCGGFKTNPVPYIANGPIWTLTWEIVCYLLVLLTGLIGVLTPAGMPVAFFASWLLYLTHLHDASDAYAVIAPLLMMFISGAFIRVAKDRINLTAVFLPALALLIFAAAPYTSDLGLSLVRHNIAFLWGPSVTDSEARRVIYLAALPLVLAYLGGVAKPLVNLRDDISYGTYVYAWPVSQTIVFVSRSRGFDLNVAELLIATLVITLPLAWLSWKIVEQPILKLKRRSPKKPDLNGAGPTARA
ncbi:acyltransferase family protein [Paraburkholderia sp. IW21]|uniref:acyltransferase family protein n=1 Tax=Paraburkholderia sp. IW21 TaxID=3242488 RepID=UPI00352230AF